MSNFFNNKQSLSWKVINVFENIFLILFSFKLKNLNIVWFTKQINRSQDLGHVHRT